MPSQHRSLETDGKYSRINQGQYMTSTSHLPGNGASRYGSRSLSAKSLHENPSRQSPLDRLRTTGSPIRTHPQQRTDRSLTESNVESRRAPRDLRSRPDSPPYALPESTARSIISRGGQLLRRQGSKFSLKSPDYEHSSIIEVSETCRRPQDASSSSRRSRKEIRKSISPPFDFHHLTHTQPRHFESLQQGSQNDLITEFIAIRASQRPKNTLQGIRADNLRNGRYIAPQSRLDSYKELPKPSVVPFHNRLTPLNDPSSMSPRLSRSLRFSSIENFSRPALQPSTHPSATAGRHESWKAAYWPPLAEESRPEHQISTTGGDVGTPSHRQTAWSTTLDAAVAGLANTATRDGISNDAQTPVESWPLPATSANVRLDAATDATTPAASPAFDVVVDAATPSQQELPDSTSVKNSVPAHGRSHRGHKIQGSISQSSQWEDAVDYSYEYAAEADCNFNWDQKTFFVDEDSDSAPTLEYENRLLEKAGTLVDSLPGSVNSDGAKSRPSSVSQSTLLDRRQLRLSCPSLYSLPESVRQLRDYQRMSQASPQCFPNTDLRSTELNSAPVSGYWDCLSMGMPSVYEEESEDCELGVSSSYDHLRTLSHKYSSDESTTSSPASTILTSRSSNSVASVPELVHSVDMKQHCSSSDENPSPADTTPTSSASTPHERSSDTRPPLHITVQPHTGSQRSVRRHRQGPSDPGPFPQSSGEVTPMTRVSIVSKPCSLSNSPVDDCNVEASKRSTVGSLKGRKRSATAGQCPTSSPCYSIFPSARPSTRLA